MKKILKPLYKYRFVLLWALILGSFGYTLWRIQAISDPRLDPNYLESQRQNQVTKLEVKESLKTQLEQLVRTPVDTEADQVGHPDPFNP